MPTAVFTFSYKGLPSLEVHSNKVKGRRGLRVEGDQTIPPFIMQVYGKVGLAHHEGP